MCKKGKTGLRTLAGLLLSAVTSFAQHPFPMTEIDEIGHLATSWDDREFADLGFARAYSDGYGTLRIEGLDDDGLPWKLWIPEVGDIGATRVFRADFDANGRPDLLFSSIYMGNGRCIEGGNVTTLLFEAGGRPVPWRISTHGLTADESMPVTVLDLDADGQAEIATSDCTYSTAQERGMAEDRWLSGVYEARDARWVPIRPFSLDVYLTAVQERFADYGEGSVFWEPVPEEWPDPLAGWDAQPALHLTGLLTAEIGCSGVARNETGCDQSATRTRLRYSDSKVRPGWPWVVIDSDKGREIHMADTREAIERLLRTGSRLRLLGPDGKPAFLWAEAVPGVNLAPLATRLIVSSSESVPLLVEEELTDERAAKAAVAKAPAESSNTASGAARRKPSEESNRFAAFLLGVPPGTAIPQTLTDCGDLSHLESAALQGERVWAGADSVQLRSLSPSERRLLLVSRFVQWNGMEQEVEFDPLPSRSGDVVGVVRFEPGWLVQWVRGGDTWLALHSRTGEPISPPVTFDIEGELFDINGWKGLTFLRWQDGTPVEMTTARATLEWIREE
jgi:hypothetical protein